MGRNEGGEGKWKACREKKGRKRDSASASQINGKVGENEVGWDIPLPFLPPLPFRALLQLLESLELLVCRHELESLVELAHRLVVPVGGRRRGRVDGWMVPGIEKVGCTNDVRLRAQGNGGVRGGRTDGG